MTQNMERLQALKSDKKFVNKAFWAYNWSIPMNFTRERMLGCSMVCMLARVADEIYPEDTVKQQELCRNHEVFFNTQQGLGAVIYGIVLGMEVERAHDDSITNELIQSIKQALAGPLAGLGDSLIADPDLDRDRVKHRRLDSRPAVPVCFLHGHQRDPVLLVI